MSAISTVSIRQPREVEAKISDVTPLCQALEDERPWLASQIGFNDWDAACTAVAEQCDVWATDYVAKRFDHGQLSDVLREQCAVRLWRVWAHHWSDEHAKTGRAVDGFEVARQIQAGRRGGRTLGGDPLSDAVFVQIGPGRADQAWPRLVDDYQGVFEEEGRRVLGRRPDGDQWRDLATRLLGADRPGHPRIWGYRGYSSLRTWLRPVMRRHLLDAFRARREQRLSGEGITTIGPTDVAATRESAEWFRDALRSGLLTLPARDRTALLLHGLRWPNGAIARRLGVSPGQASRIRAGAVARLTNILFAADPARFAELRDATDADGRWFASILSEVLMGKTIEYGGLDDPFATGPKRRQQLFKPASKIFKVDKYGHRKIDAKDDAPDTDEQLSKDYLPDDDSIHVATPKDRASEVFEALIGQDAERRPTVVCLDGREVQDQNKLADWLGQFDARVNEQFNDTAAEDPYEPQLVVIVTEMADQSAQRLSVESTLIVAPSGPAADVVYRQFLVAGLGDLLHATPGLSAVEPDPRATPPQHQNAAQADEWDARMRQLAEWSDDPTSFGG